MHIFLCLLNEYKKYIFIIIRIRFNSFYKGWETCNIQKLSRNILKYKIWYCEYPAPGFAFFSFSHSLCEKNSLVIIVIMCRGEYFFFCNTIFLSKSLMTVINNQMKLNVITLITIQMYAIILFIFDISLNWHRAVVFEYVWKYSDLFTSQHYF